MGFDTKSGSLEEGLYEKMKDNIMEDLKTTFRPEFLNRIDDIIVFHQLEVTDLKAIVKLMLIQVSERLKEQGIEIEFTNQAETLLAKEGTDLTYGARPLRRAITKMIEDKLSEEMLKGKVKKGDTVKVNVKNNEIVFTT